MKTQYVVCIQPDEYPENPRDNCSNFGTLYTWHNRYILGGKDDYSNEDQDTFTDYLALDVLHMDPDSTETEIIATIKENVCMVPVYMYDHSGITISTTPFSCPWDSGQVGWIFVTKEKCKAEGIKFEDADEVMKSEIRELDYYLTGDVWCYDVYQHEVEDAEEDVIIAKEIPEFGEVLDSCSGFYGYDYCKEQALDVANWHVKNRAEQEIAA